VHRGEESQRLEGLLQGQSQRGGSDNEPTQTWGGKQEQLVYKLGLYAVRGREALVKNGTWGMGMQRMTRRR